LYLFYKGKEKIEDKQVNNDFFIKIKKCKFIRRY
jgi:hypothetical protein